MNIDKLHQDFHVRLYAGSKPNPDPEQNICSGVGLNQMPRNLLISGRLDLLKTFPLDIKKSIINELSKLKFVYTGQKQLSAQISLRYQIVYDGFHRAEISVYICDLLSDPKRATSESPVSFNWDDEVRYTFVDDTIPVFLKTSSKVQHKEDQIREYLKEVNWVDTLRGLLFTPLEQLALTAEG